MIKITILFPLVAMIGCAHGMSSHLEKFDENTPKDYDPEAYNQAYDQKYQERKKEDPRFEQFRKKVVEPSKSDQAK